MAQQTIGTPVKATPYTVSFQENVKGWVSFKSFIPENGISCASNYFTFNKGRLFRHHDEGKLVSRNTFYGVRKESTVDFIFNQASGTIKSFEAINYEGSQAKVEAKRGLSGQLVSAGVSNTVNLDNYGENFEIAARNGWYVQNLETEQDKGTLKEFVNKEKKWFNYIHGTNLNVSEDSTVSDYDPRNFANQGLGVVTSSPVNEIVQGCTCNGSNQNGNGVVVDCTSAGDLGYNFINGTVAAFNYYDAAQVDDGSCVEVAHGCIDANATNYNADANTDDGSCYTLGCTDELAINYNELADTACNPTGLPDDPDADPDFANDCCTFCIYGCTNSGANNYDPTATCDGKFGDVREDGKSCDELGEGIDCGCSEIEYGCLDTNDYSFSNTTIANLSTTANTENGSCIYNGCSDPSAQYFRVPLPIPYDPDYLVTTNPAAFAIDASGVLLDINVCGAGNIGDPLCASRACWSVINDMQTDSLNADYQSYLTQLSAIGPDLNLTTLQPCPTDPFDTTNCTYSTVGCTDPIGCSYSAQNTVDDGSCLYCGESNYFNYDGGYTLSGGTCGPSTQSGNCSSCPIVDPSSMAIQSQDPNEVSLWFQVSYTDQTLAALTTNFPLGGVPGWLDTPGFKFRLYDLNTMPTGGSAWNDADYEVVDFNSAFGAPGAGFLAQHYTTTSLGTTTEEARFKSTVLKPGITSVVGSRQGGVMSTSTGYNGNTTLSLGCGHQYQLALQTQCVNPDNNHLSTADWQQNVGVITMDPCTNPDVFGCPYNPLMFNSDCESGNQPTANPYTPCQDGVTIDDGSCVLFENVGCMDPALVININAPSPGEHAINYNYTYTHDCNGNLPAAGTYGDNSCCVWRGCTDPTAIGFYDPQANFPDHNVDYTLCEPKPVRGCTDPLADNYDPNATQDDGSCEYCTPRKAIHLPFNKEVELAWDLFSTPSGHVFDEFPQPTAFSGTNWQNGWDGASDPLVIIPHVNHFMWEDAGLSTPGQTQPLVTRDYANTTVQGGEDYPIPAKQVGKGGYIEIRYWSSREVPETVGGYNPLQLNPSLWPPLPLDQQLGASNQAGLAYFHTNSQNSIGYDPIATMTARYNSPPNTSTGDFVVRYDGNPGYPGYPVGPSFLRSTYMNVYESSELTSTFTGSNYNQVQPYEFSGGWGYGQPSQPMGEVQDVVNGQTGIFSPPARSMKFYNQVQANQLFIVEMEVVDAERNRYCPRNVIRNSYIIAKQGTDPLNPGKYAAEDGSGLIFNTQQELVEYLGENYKNMHADGWTGPGPIII